MNTKTRNAVLNYIRETSEFSQADVRGVINKRSYSKLVDNTVGRFVRRMASDGILKRTKNGFMATTKGRKMIDRQLV